TLRARCCCLDGAKHSRHTNRAADVDAGDRDDASALDLGAAAMMREYSLALRSLATGLLGLMLAAGCGSTMNEGSTTQPPPPVTLDDQLRAQFGVWGIVPIGAVAPPNAALVDLGRSLFFDKILSGNRDVSCATCHSPLTHGADALALSIGTGGTG